MARTAPKGDPPEEVIHARGGRRIALIAKTSQAGASDSWDTSARSTDTPTPHGVLFDPASRDRQFHSDLTLTPSPIPSPSPSSTTARSPASEVSA